MWGANSQSQRFPSNTKFPIDIGKNNIINNSSVNNKNQSEFNMEYQTPIKQFENIPINNNNVNTTPFRFDFNQYFGNLWSSGKLPNNQLQNQQLMPSPSQYKKDNLLFLKKSIDKSYRLTPVSQMKDNNSINNSNNIVILNNGNSDSNNNNGNELYDVNNTNNNNNLNDFAKKNLNELFNNAKNDTFLYEEQKKQLENNIIQNNINNKYIKLNKRNEKHKHYNLQISRQFIFSSPSNLYKPKKIFECSGASLATNSTIRTNNYKNKRFRKNNEQINLLKKFYDEHKHWTKNQIKEISQKIGLKENKVYKWLWDQRNKELKSTKFVVKKDKK